MYYTDKQGGQWIKQTATVKNNQPKRGYMVIKSSSLHRRVCACVALCIGYLKTAAWVNSFALLSSLHTDP